MGGELSSFISAQVHGPVTVRFWGCSVWLWSVGHLLGEHGETGQRVCSMRRTTVEGEPHVGCPHPRVMICVEVASVWPLALPLVAIWVVHVVGDLQKVQEADGSCSR